jgi:hypothetical protein
LLDCGCTLIERDTRRGHRHQDQDSKDRECAPPPPDALTCGVVRGAEERLAGGRQRRIAGGRVTPASDSGVDGGEPARPVQIRGVPAADIPGSGVGDDLAVHGAVELVVAEPVPELFPGLQQDVVRNLNAVVPKDKQTLGAEHADDRIDVGDGYSWPAQVSPVAPAPLELAVHGNGGELGKHQARRRLLLAAEAVVSGLGAAVDRIADSARR